VIVLMSRTADSKSAILATNGHNTSKKLFLATLQNSAQMVPIHSPDLLVDNS
jgi:hypothetical protein